MLEIGDKIKFGKRSGKVMAITTFECIGEYYVVELDRDSGGYLEPIGNDEHDCYISMMLVHVGNEE